MGRPVIVVVAVLESLETQCRLPKNISKSSHATDLEPVFNLNRSYSLRHSFVDIRPMSVFEPERQKSERVLKRIGNSQQSDRLEEAFDRCLTVRHQLGSLSVATIDISVTID